MAFGPNSGPKHGSKAAQRTGRARGTVRDLMAQGRRADPFPLGPQDVSAIGQQRAALKYTDNVTRASLKQQAALARAAFRQQRLAINEETRTGIHDVQASAMERGVAGSTAAVAGEQGVIGARESALGEARLQRTQALMGISQSRLEAIGQLRMGLAQLAMQRAAAQRQMALGAYASGGQNPWGY